MSEEERRMIQVSREDLALFERAALDWVTITMLNPSASLANLDRSAIIDLVRRHKQYLSTGESEKE